MGKEIVLRSDGKKVVLNEDKDYIVPAFVLQDFFDVNKDRFFSDIKYVKPINKYEERISILEKDLKDALDEIRRIKKSTEEYMQIEDDSSNQVYEYFIKCYFNRYGVQYKTSQTKKQRQVLKIKEMLFEKKNTYTIIKAIDTFFKIFDVDPAFRTVTTNLNIDILYGWRFHIYDNIKSLDKVSNGNISFSF